MDQEEDDLKRFAADEDDERIRPIDTDSQTPAGAETAPPGAPEDEPAGNPVPPIPDAGLPGSDGKTLEGPAGEPGPEEPAEPFLKDEPEPFLRDEPEPAAKDAAPPSSPGPMQGRDEKAEDMSLSEDFVLRQDERAEEERREAYNKSMAELGEARMRISGEEPKYVEKGEFVDLMEQFPTLRSIMVGVGWDNRSFEDSPVDVDLSLFLLDKTDMTRIDEDFVFYNNERAFEGAVRHYGDSRTGAGDGDDENVFIDLTGISFDILKIAFVITIYDPEYQGLNFGEIKNAYFRIFNHEDREEILRFKLEDQSEHKYNGMAVATMIREGPKWIFEAQGSYFNGGLAKIATDYGIIIKELQSTGDSDAAMNEEGDELD